jgi:hypothetical protein
MCIEALAAVTSACFPLQGVVDENTLVWGQGLIDWLPMRNVKLLVAQVRTPEGECNLTALLLTGMQSCVSF